MAFYISPPLSLILACKQRPRETTPPQPFHECTPPKLRSVSSFPGRVSSLPPPPSPRAKLFIRQSSRKSWNGCRLRSKEDEASSCWPKICIFKVQPLSPPLIERAENLLYNWCTLMWFRGGTLSLRYLRSSRALTFDVRNWWKVVGGRRKKKKRKERNEDNFAV